MIRIVEIGQVAWQGVTEPIFCRGEDGLEYIVKGKHAGYRSLIAEWIANRLGHLVGLPNPQIAQMEISTALFDYGIDKEKLSKLGRGTLFGSQKVDNVVEFRSSDLKTVDVTIQAEILAFDLWVANSDRVFVEGLGNPNLLWSEDRQGVVVIDFNNAFLPESMVDFWVTHAFRNAGSVWSETFRSSMEARFRSALDHLEEIWNELPVEWTETCTEFSLASVSSILWKFDSDATSFWSPP